MRASFAAPDQIVRRSGCQGGGLLANECQLRFNQRLGFRAPDSLISMSTPILALAAASLLALAGAAMAADQPGVTLTLKDHRFTPAVFGVPAGQAVRINLINQDPASEEFDSHDLRVEEVVAPMGRVSFTIGPLRPGQVQLHGRVPRRHGPGQGRRHGGTLTGMFASALPSALIVFREVLEAGLIVGVVLAATEGVARRGRWIAGGIAAGVLGAMLVAAVFQQISDAFSGVGQDVFNAVILIAAVCMLSWHIIWMSKHSREMVRDMKTLGRKLTTGETTLAAMATVVAVAVLREGSEVVLILSGIVAGGGVDPAAMLAGGALGVAGGAAVSFVLYRGLLVIPTGKLFAVTNGLIALLAAGMAGQAAVHLAQANLIPSLGDQLWDTSGFLRDDSLLGRVLHALFGYSDRPMGVQLLVYLLVLATLLTAGRLIGSAPKRASPPEPAE